MTDEFDMMLGLEIDGFGSDGDNHFFIGLADGSELEFTINEYGELEVSYYAGYLDSWS